VRAGDDIGVTAEAINDDQFFTMAMPMGWDLPADDTTRSHVDSQTAAALVAQERVSGGYSTPYLRLRIVLEGRRNQPIQVTDLVPTNIHMGPPINGTLVAISAEGGHQNQQVVFDLANPVGSAQDATLGDSPGPYFKNKTVSLADKEQVILTAQFNSRPGTATDFDLTLQYTLGGSQKTLTFNDHGQPFHVTSPSCSGASDGSFDYRQVYSMEDISSGYRLSKLSDPRHFTVALLQCQ